VVTDNTVEIENTLTTDKIMQVTVLGCGTSLGVPVIGCACAICKSTSKKNKRLRSSLALFFPALGKRIIIDTSPDLRMQCLNENISSVDAIFYTHIHADHIHGIDDSRVFSFGKKVSLPAYADSQTASTIKARFPYATGVVDLEYAGSPPKLEFIEITRGVSFEVFPGVSVLPLRLIHGPIEVTGFRIGSFAYLTDCNEIPIETAEMLKGVQTAIICGLRYKTSSAHFSLEEAARKLHELEISKGYINHLNHEVEYNEGNIFLTHLGQGDVELCYDGLSFEMPY
jgi:phosphoribosyl 1,2-cyclic phosphate phosphodiesterase